MKRYLIALTVLAASTLSFAQMMPMPARGGPEGFAFMRRGPYLSAEAQAIEAELGDKGFGELSLNELLPYGKRLALAASKDSYVEKSAMLSMRLPGLGQFKNGDAGGGALFLGAHLAVVAGSLLGEYFLLPSDLRFDRLNYFTSSISGIKSAWGSHSLEDYLPAIGVAAAGMVLDGGIRIWSARSAYADAKASVDAGSAKLRPMVGPGFLGMGMRY
jgi:hypothetical protein